MRGQIVDPIVEAREKRIKDLEAEILLRNKILDRFIAGLPVDYIKYYNAIQASEHSNLKKSKENL